MQVVSQKYKTKEQEVSEVESALEELKNQIVSFRLNFDMDYKPMRYLPDAAQNLINALETEKKPFFKVREEGQFEGLPPSAEALARYDMSKPEPKIDIQKPCVDSLNISGKERIEPVSIRKETYRCAHDYVLKNQGYNNSDHLIREYECSICGENKMTIQQ